MIQTSDTRRWCIGCGIEITHLDKRRSWCRDPACKERGKYAKKKAKKAAAGGPCRSDPYETEPLDPAELKRRQARALAEADAQFEAQKLEPDWQFLDLLKSRPDSGYKLSAAGKAALKQSRDAAQNGSAGHLDRVARARAMADAKASGAFLSKPRKKGVR